MAKFTQTLEEDGSTTWQSKLDWPHGSPMRVFFGASGDFGSGTLTVEYSFDEGVTAIPDGELSFTDDGVAWFYAHPGLRWRATLASSSNPDIVVSFIA